MQVEAAPPETMPIASEDDIVLVRRRVRELAQGRGFDSFATAAITTATSELCRNVWQHARGGVATLQEVRAGERLGLRLEFRDQGPGIADVEQVMSEGYRSRTGLGLGLSGSQRLVDDFRVDSHVGRGTVVTVVKWKRAL